MCEKHDELLILEEDGLRCPKCEGPIGDVPIVMKSGALTLMRWP